MKLAFGEPKATQAAALFLKLAGGALNYLALIKLLYKGRSRGVAETGPPDHNRLLASMKLDPITSTIYDRIKTSANPNAHPTFWSAHIQRAADPLLVTLRTDPGNSELSPAEEKLIADIFAVDGGKDRFMLADECHKAFPELSDPGQKLRSYRYFRHRYRTRAFRGRSRTCRTLD